MNITKRNSFFCKTELSNLNNDSAFQQTKLDCEVLCLSRFLPTT